MSILICPLCQNPLKLDTSGATCPNRHHFDRAAQGYVHLLPANRMNSKLPGDSKQMADARRRFLSGGFYRPLADAVCQSITTEFSRRSYSRPVILDAGCGEGYYTSSLQQHLVESEFQPVVFGFDVSKMALKSASKATPSVTYAVASLFHLPVADASADCVINLFAPIAAEEFHRVLRKNGMMLLVVPGKRHLFGLKEFLYEHPYENDTKDFTFDGFSFIEKIEVKDKISLNNHQDIADLFTMTPYFWKTPAESRAKLEALNQLDTEIEFELWIFRKQVQD